MRRVCFFLILVWNVLFSEEVSFRSPGGGGEQLFAPPHILSPEEVSEGLTHRFLDASWVCLDGHFRFVSTHTHIYFEAQFGDFISHYGTCDRSPPVGEYLLYTQRAMDEPVFSLITLQDLKDILRQKHALWYTGAGISLGAGVPAMQQLNALLGITEGEGFAASVRSACLVKEDLAARIGCFHKACFFSPPTKAHYAVKELTLKRLEPLLTENLDYLHEYTGVMPLRIDVEKMRKEINPSQLQQIDCIVCIGLSHDDRGFLGWYKAHNPQGMLIAIDLARPAYLGAGDLLLRGDLQEIVPQLIE